ncbi:hypothetical protein B0H17DRAFT_1249172 [Mycena rosella]|uniref:RNase III domain-containing protein n=1 Tax=Mycena rosella TaxID=1033263 RepID=A0AAD7H0P8_MYCRO|nr:hypothetical protein B0H17DRAFT_1249172 [Mycena rosella]
MAPTHTRLDRLISDATYTPQAMVLPRAGLEMLNGDRDPETLNGLETTGDARVGYVLALIQEEYFPDILLADHKASLAQNISRCASELLSNADFQRLVRKLGIKVDDDAFHKGVGNAFEVLVEVAGRVRGHEVTSRWLEDLFVPLLRGMLLSARKRKTRRQKNNQGVGKENTQKKKGGTKGSTEERKRQRRGVKHSTVDVDVDVDENVQTPSISMVSSLPISLPASYTPPSTS